MLSTLVIFIVIVVLTIIAIMLYKMKTRNSKFVCIPGYNTPMRVNDIGDVECYSTDAINCHWSKCPDTSVDIKNVKPLSCGIGHIKAYGKTGYSIPDHWCNHALDYFKNS